jgi:hypothetical protein
MDGVARFVSGALCYVDRSALGVVLVLYVQGGL